MNHSQTFLSETARICSALDTVRIEEMVDFLIDLKKRAGRLFLLGVGGSAANCSHAVNDFRKLCGIEAYAPSDNVSELTARTNDEGWNTVFKSWLETSNLNKNDAIFILSVGGGNSEKQVSMNLVKALEYAISREVPITGIVGRDGGFTAKAGKPVVIIPTIHPDRITPHTEAFQAVVWHCLVSHPKLQVRKTKW
jgi:D-sedoheptulose 7-phosphate isomerase